MSTTVDSRQIGPVTTAATGGVAAAGIICWLVEIIWHVDVPTDVQTYIGVILVIAAGWAIKPHTKTTVGEHAA
jgi:hypothetical protein